MLPHNQRCRLFQKNGSRCSKEDFVHIPSQRSRIPSFYPDSQNTRPDAHQSSTRNGISFTDTDMGRQLHPFGRHGNTVRTLSLIRQDVEKNCNRLDDRATPSGRGPYYGIYVQQKCNHLDARATASGQQGNTVRTRP
jgi:hypothetical protein